MFHWLAACEPPAPRKVVPDDGHTAVYSDATGGWWYGHTGFDPELWILDAAVGPADVCVFADAGNGYYGIPAVVSAYRLPLDSTAVAPEPGPPLPDSIYLDRVAVGPGDTCYAALRHENGEDAIVYLVGPDGVPDEQFGRLDLPDTTVTSLTPEGDAVWVGGEDAEGGYLRRYTRDGAFDRRRGEVRLPVVPVQVRVREDGFAVTTWRPDALWRTDRAGHPWAGFGTDGRVGVPGLNPQAEVAMDLDTSGNALVVHMVKEAPFVRHRAVRVITVEGTVTPAVRLPEEVRAARWDGADQLWIEPYRVTRHTTDGTQDPTFAVDGVLTLPQELRGDRLLRGAAGTVLLYYTQEARIAYWTTQVVSDRP